MEKKKNTKQDINPSSSYVSVTTRFIFLKHIQNLNKHKQQTTNFNFSYQPYSKQNVVVCYPNPRHLTLLDALIKLSLSDV